ncbi:dTDP-4-dehydrorhamnose reductase [Polymorphum gilvum]|uniref:dTDP-4-dehydrorhamnose reductase n=1 Tax=Polymorphum gilvum (strain LMG 25793 / CGMCC 1.9160 / SL003B-26A1) TaxID=991905 RepID=F2J3F1_POLGS|nr:dTDP-4-dehydrorhamnose reductase [Polymorphum gilvum]ADZ70976.1 dTDP 4-dehydrorhamnose reductase (DTDP-L-rhamnose synthetase) [Polymorphum gilvum SL003B-26A1]
MKAILLGPNGQLGTDIVRANTALGAPLDLHPLDRQALDLTDFETVRTVLGSADFDVLINCSSYHKTDDVEQNAQLGVTVNAHLVQLLARLCEQRAARFVHVSTDYVFGGQSKRTPLSEDDPTAPVNVYGASKAMGETLATLACARTTVLRVASLFGIAGASGKGGNFVETMIRFGREKGALRVVADQHMSPTSTYDIATTLIDMLKADVEPGIWHVVNSGDATWHAFAEEIIRQTGIAATVEPITSAEFPTPAMRPPYSVLSNAKVAAVVGERRHWTVALRDYLRDKGHI